MSGSPSAARLLVGDVGGTNARFALLDDGGRAIGPPVTLRTDEHPGIVEAVRSVIASHGDVALDAAAIAVNGPVVGDAISLSNSDWAFSIGAAREALGLTTLHVVNDFTALALSVPHLPTDELRQVGGGSAQARHAIAVIGPGTGLGVSGLVPCGSQWTALQGEGGHVTLGGGDARDQAVHAQLAQRFEHVSAERFLSGPGLVNIHAALRAIDGLAPLDRSPADISHLGIAGSDPVCVETLDCFCRLLGKVAGNLVLTLGAEGGCYIGGGVVPRLGEFFHRSGFRDAFEAKGRMSHYLRRVPTFVIHSDAPALLGAARLLL